jgi:uncharacterized phage protein gp47/JayE
MAPNWTAMLPFRSPDELVSQVATHLQSAGSRITNWNRGGVARRLTEALVQPIADLYVAMLKVLPHGWPQHATGSWLDAHAVAMGTERRRAQAARGHVVFARADGVSGNVAIPAHARVATAVGADGRRVVFRPLADSVLPSGAPSVSLECACELPGSAGNVGAGTLIELLTPIAGVGSVSNAADWITQEGADEESDPQLQGRLAELWTALGFGSNRAAHAAWALAVPGVASVWVDDDHPRGQGTVDIYITGPSGSPSPALLAAVNAAVQAKRNVTSDVAVLGPVAVPVAVSVRVVLAPGKGVLEEAQAAARRRIEAYFRVGEPIEGLVPIEIAEDVHPGRLVFVAQVPDAYRVEVLAPATPVVVSHGQVAQLGSLAVEAVRVEEL